MSSEHMVHLLIKLSRLENLSTTFKDFLSNLKNLFHECSDC